MAHTGWQCLASPIAVVAMLLHPGMHLLLHNAQLLQKGNARILEQGVIRAAVDVSLAVLKCCQERICLIVRSHLLGDANELCAYWHRVTVH